MESPRQLNKASIKNDTLFGIKGIIRNDGKILVLVKPNGRFDLPGGRVNPFESVKSCLKREIKEETSLKVEILLPVVSSWSFIKSPEKTIRGVTSLCKPDSTLIELSDEHIDFFWISIEKFHRLTFRPSYGTENQSESLLKRQIAKSVLELPQINYL